MKKFEKNSNKKALMFLLLLSAFGFLCIKFTKVQISTASENAETSNSSCSSNLVDTSYDSSNATVFNITDDGTVTELTSTGTVLGENDTCELGANQYEATSACTIDTATVSVDGSEYVSSNASVSLISVKVPVALLSGIESVKDSNREITNETYTYKPAGELFDDKQISVSIVPGEDGSSTRSTILENSVQQEAYSTSYTISTGSKDADGNITVDQYMANDCGADCNNASNTNPDKSNQASEYLKNIYYDYPGQSEETTEDSDILQISGSCKNSDSMEVTANTEYGCFSVWKAITGFIGSLFPSSDWTSCANGGEGCIKAETIAVMISPMFEETNAYTSTRNKSAMSPDDSTSYNPVYVVTDCTASVAGKTTGVKCIWDMSYLFDERKAAEYDDVGGSDTPTEDQYKTFLENESATRTETQSM